MDEGFSLQISIFFLFISLTKHRCIVVLLDHIYIIFFLRKGIWPEMASTILLPSQAPFHQSIIMPTYGVFTFALYLYVVLDKFSSFHTTYDKF